jgi:acetyl esterase/lipase
MTPLRLGLAYVVLALVVPCPLFSQENARATPSDLKVTKDIVFKQVGDTSLDLWLFEPLKKRSERAPLVVYIHGGGWGGGDKTRVLKRDLVNVIRQLNQNGVVCASIEYRLANGGKATAYDSAADCMDAVRFLAKNAEKYQLDPDRIGIFGSSAGGNLGLVTALGEEKDYPCDPSLNDHKGKIRCVAAYYPLTSFVNPEVLKGSNFERLQRFVPILGGALEEKREIARKLSPIELLKKDSPAIFVAHGDADKTLSFKNATLLESAAREKGGPVECVIAKGADHGFRGTNITPTVEEINQRTVDFFLKYLTP